MHLNQQEIELPAPRGHGSILAYLAREIDARLTDEATPIRFVVAESKEDLYRCEIAAFHSNGDSISNRNSISFSRDSLLKFARRTVENTQRFNAVLMIPTGVGADIGGHAGDASPVAQLLASVCDTLITHPNVVNASDINEMPPNSLYVEGGALCRMLMGTAGLQPVRSNRVLVVIDSHYDQMFVDGAINAVNAARASYGLICPRVVQLDPPLEMRSSYSASGTAVGHVAGLDRLFRVLDQHRGDYDAIAISSVISVPPSYHRDYFQSAGRMVNPWGGVEAILTHTISASYDLPSAHSPMLESEEIANIDTGIVDPRMAAEAISLTFLQSILKGLQRSPKIVTDRDAMMANGVLTASDVACLVIPDGCLGLPTLAALEQGVPVISVRENRTLMRNDLTSLPWKQGQLHIVDNYWEAAGVMAALKAGIDPKVVRRPMSPITVEHERTLSVDQHRIERSDYEARISELPNNGFPSDLEPAFENQLPIDSVRYPNLQ